MSWLQRMLNNAGATRTSGRRKLIIRIKGFFGDPDRGNRSPAWKPYLKRLSIKIGILIPSFAFIRF